MKIGVVIAIARELKAFLDSKTHTEVQTVNGWEIYRAPVGKNEIFAVKSGYGKIDAAAATQVLISSCGCEVILNFGVTGALEPSLRVDDLFVVTKALNYDYDVSPIDPVKKHQYEEFPDEYIPLDSGLVAFAKTLCPTLKEAVVASGDRFVEEKEDKDTLRDELGCTICDMEIAAIARICLLNKVRCLSVKCISDTYAGDGGDFNKNVTASAAKAFALIENLWDKL